MIYTNNTKKAINLLFEKQKDQRDKFGIPYIFHPYHVAEQMDDEISTTVALLHDIVEDTDTTFTDLEQMGFPQEVVDTLHLLTHKEGVDYFDYIKNIATNPIAVKVKLADLEHNMDPSRIEEPTEIDLERREKYKKAYCYLLEVSSKEKDIENNTQKNY